MNSTIEQRVRELRAEGQLVSSGTFTRMPPTPPAPPLRKGRLQRLQPRLRRSGLLAAGR
jgi:hypothetical protein